MVPIVHGVPAVGLVPKARLWLNRRGTGWCGSYGEAWMLHIWKEYSTGEYALMLGPCGERATKVCDLVHQVCQESGTAFLTGYWGIECIVAKKNPTCVRGAVTVYGAIRPPQEAREVAA